MPIKITESDVRLPLSYPLSWGNLLRGEVYEDDQGDIVIVQGSSYREKDDYAICIKDNRWFIFNYASHTNIKFRGPISAEFIFNRALAK